MKKIFFFFFLFGVLALPSLALAVTLNVPIGEVTKVANFSEYVKLWYNFVLGTVGIVAAVMIMWGGFKWLTSRGESEAIKDAKERIIGAITGLVLAFLSYTILFLINPNLVYLSMPELTKADFSNLAGSHGSVSQTSGPTNQAQSQQGVSRVCADNSGTVLNYSNVPAQQPPSGYTNPQSSYDQNQLFERYGQQYGVEPNVLRAIAGAESSNGRNRGPSSAGARGLMQLMPATAQEVATHFGITYNENDLMYNDDLNIQLAAAFISQNQEGLGTADIFAGYNADYARGSGHALSQSRDCEDNVRAYQCCTNPGGLVETQDYVQRTSSYYNYYNE